MKGDWPKISPYARLFSWQLLVLAVLVGILWKVPIWQTNAYRTRLDIKGLLPIEQLQREQGIVTAENNARVTLAQIFAGGFLLLGLYFTWRNLSITEEGKLTDRFSNAVELLGNKTLSVRLGGIYALERIARDSQKDHWTVMEVLTGFVRENARRGSEPEGSMTLFLPAEIRTDVQAVLTVIGRRKWIDRERHAPPGQAMKPGEGLDLSRTNLRNASLSGNFAFANLSGSDLNGANLRDANLTNARLDRADIRGARLMGCNLIGTQLIEANLSGAKLAGADLFAASLIGASLLKTDLSAKQLDGASISESTKLPPDLRIYWEKSQRAEADFAKRFRALDPES